mmetsp:Transcript_1558/g.4629  ORF Transcript_1558/g.4629 Transcript_1558/m.4629 type:complete len:135 (+) Transcript_1558:101-505(+)
MARFSVILALIGTADAFVAPAQQALSLTSRFGYVPEGLSAGDWAQRQAKEKAAKQANKKKYPFGAPQVLGVKEYLEQLADKQTFGRDSTRNVKVQQSGHMYAKVKFGDFTKEAFDAWKNAGGKAKPNVPTYKDF